MSLYQAAAAMNANARWQEVISENLAASNIPGFKKQEVSFETLQAGLLTPGAGGVQGDHPAGITTLRQQTNFSPGPIRRTEVDTDFAIEGEGFFEVQLPNGATAYTRDGEFKIDALGQLVTKQGYPVMGENGTIQLDRNNSVGITVAPDGTISQGDQVRGKLQLTQFNDPKLLTDAGGGVFLARDPNLQALPEAAGSVRQGYLETANTSAVLEMANLIRVMRSFEANQRVMQTQSDRMSRAITELGNPN